jgi:hypothetical protein
MRSCTFASLCNYLGRSRVGTSTVTCMSGSNHSTVDRARIPQNQIARRCFNENTSALQRIGWFERAPVTPPDQMR